MAAQRITIATRGSKLALWQSEHAAARLREAHPALEVQLRVISTKGDEVIDKPLSKVGDKGLFTAELEAALRDKSADIAVHSYKDLPTVLPPDLAVHAVLQRADSRDVLLVRGVGATFMSPNKGGMNPAPTAPAGLPVPPDGTFSTLPHSAKLGTSSLRRRAQALALRPDLNIHDLRGNVDTRVAKLQRGDYDAIILAAAGLIRLGILDAALAPVAGKLDAAISVEALTPPEWLTAPSQGAIAIEGRAGDERVSELCAELDHAATRLACDAERAFMRTLEGGCQVPVGAYAAPAGAYKFWLDAGVFSLDGTRAMRETIEVSVDDVQSPVVRLARDMLARGADKILREARGQA